MIHSLRFTSGDRDANSANTLLTAQHVDLRRPSTAATTQGHDYTTHGTGSVGTGSMGHLGHLSRPGHRVAILTRCETLDFPVYEKMPNMQNVHSKC